MPNLDVNSESLRSLKELLLLVPPAAGTGSRIILTTAPHVWKQGEELAETEVLDLSAILGSSHIFPASDLYLEEETYRAFLAVGWPETFMRRQFSPTSKSRKRLDIALFDSEDKLVGAVKVKGTSRKGKLGDQLPKLTLHPLSWIETDFLSYYFRRPNGEIRETNTPPTPADLGVVVPESVPRATQISRAGLRPSTISDLAGIMDEHSPRFLVFDFTLWEGHQDTSLLKELQELMPHDVTDLTEEEGNVTFMLLAWVASLKTVELVSAITPFAIAWFDDLQGLRDYLNARLGLLAHFELPVSTFDPFTFYASFLLLGNDRSFSYFDTLTNDDDLLNVDETSWYESFIGWLEGQPPVRGYEEDRALPQDWSVKANDRDSELTRRRLGNLGKTYDLQELCEVGQGPTLHHDDMVTHEDEGAIVVIDGRKLRANSDNDTPPLYLSKNAKLHEIDYLQTGDVLLIRAHLPSRQAIVHSNDTPSVAASDVIVLRPFDNTISKNLAEFLNSYTGRQLLATIYSDSTVPRSPFDASDALIEMPVVLIDIDMKDVAEIDVIRDALAAKADQLEAQRRSLFDSENRQQFQNKLTELRRKGSLLRETLFLSESLDFQISQFFPFPLAYSYRLLASHVDPFRRYQEQLRVAENILSFLGSVSLALVDQEDRSLLEGRLRDYWKGGISPGSWKDLIARCSRIFKGYEGNPLAGHIYRSRVNSEKKGLGKELKFLVEAKNDFKHDRGPKAEQDVVAHSKELHASLHRCMELLTFLTSHPIRQVQVSDAVRGQPGRIQLKCLRIVGDHPGFAQENLVWHEAQTRGDLYIEVADRYWKPLYPFIQMLTCPHCKTEEVYFIDKWNTEKGVVTMKSFDRGHTETDDQSAGELEKIVGKITEG